MSSLHRTQSRTLQKDLQLQSLRQLQEALGWLRPPPAFASNWWAKVIQVSNAHWWYTYILGVRMSSGIYSISLSLSLSPSPSRKVQPALVLCTATSIQPTALPLQETAGNSNGHAVQVQFFAMSMQHCPWISMGGSLRWKSLVQSA